MENKQKLLVLLEKEKVTLEARREQILNKVDEERAEYNEEYPSPVIDDYVSELQSLTQHIFELDNTIRSIKNSNCTSNKKLGELINVGDCVTLKGKDKMKQYFITNDSHYVNPQLGVISSGSPIAQQLINKKFGEKIALSLNGMQLEYQLLP
jgi:transcription elongation GreA/GreB family factor